MLRIFTFSVSVALLASVIQGISAYTAYHGYHNRYPYHPQKKLTVSLTDLHRPLLPAPAPAPAPAPSPPRCNPETEFQSGEKCYRISSEPLNWGEARDRCKSDGYQLVEIISGDEYVDIIAALKEGYSTSSYWVGGCRWTLQSEWCWCQSEESIQDTFWTISNEKGKPVKEPQNDPTENCVLMDASRHHFLNPARCSDAEKFICERRLPAFLPVQSPAPPPSPQPSPNVHFAVFYKGEDGEEGDAMCPQDWALNEDNHKCYRYLPTSMSFDEADKFCRSHDSSLVSVGSKEENYYLAEMFDEPTSFWIGLRTVGHRDFQWVTHEEVTFVNWDKGYPQSSGNGYKRCAVLVSRNGKWRDVGCDQSVEKPSVCERDATYDAQK